MSDLFLGQTCTEAYKFISAGTAHTFEYNWQPDMVIFNNLTTWTATAAGTPRSFWFRDQTTAARCFQEQVIDSAAGSSFNFLNTAANGFTVADTSGGQSTSHANISGISAADPGVVTHAAFTFQTNQIVRLTDLGQVTSATDRGMGELNNNRYRIVVTAATTFTLKDPVTGEAIDTSSMTAYVSGGIITLETHVLSLNNPQVSPYSSTSPYNPNEYIYDPITYQLTAGTSVMGSDSDVFLMEAHKWGNFEDLGDLLT